MATAKPPYGGIVLRSGSSGPDVALVQTWLNSVRSKWPSIGQLTVDGRYGPATRRAVQAYQTAAGLAADGSVGANTWASLGAEYATQQGDGEIYPGITLRSGHSGATVRSAQQRLKLTVPSLVVDGRYGSKTQAAVRSYQTTQGLPVDGLLGKNTWASLYGQ